MSAPDTIVLIHGFWVTPRSWENWVALLRGQGLQGHRAGLSRASRSRSRRSTPTRRRSPTLTVPEDRRPPRVGRRAAREPDHHGPLRRRRVHADPARPRLRRLGRRAELRPDRGREGRAVVAAAVDVPGAQEPGEPPPRGRLHLRAVPLRVHQRRRRGDRAAAVRALRGRRPTAASCSTASWPTSSPATRTRGSTTTTTDRAPLLFISGSHDHIMPPSVQKSNAKHYKARQARSPRSSSSRARTSCRRSRAGRRSPTTRSNGRSRTPASTRRSRPESCRSSPPPTASRSSTRTGAPGSRSSWRTAGRSAATAGRRSSSTSPTTASARSRTTAAGTAAPPRCGTATTWTTTRTISRR